MVLNMPCCIVCGGFTTHSSKSGRKNLHFNTLSGNFRSLVLHSYSPAVEPRYRLPWSHLYFLRTPREINPSFHKTNFCDLAHQFFLLSYIILYKSRNQHVCQAIRQHGQPECFSFPLDWGYRNYGLRYFFQAGRKKLVVQFLCIPGTQLSNNHVCSHVILILVRPYYQLLLQLVPFEIFCFIHLTSRVCITGLFIDRKDHELHQKPLPSCI